MSNVHKFEIREPHRPLEPDHPPGRLHLRHHRPCHEPVPEEDGV